MRRIIISMWQQFHCGCMWDFGCTVYVRIKKKKLQHMYKHAGVCGNQLTFSRSFCSIVYFICYSYQYSALHTIYSLPHTSASTFQFHLIFQQLTKKPFIHRIRYMLSIANISKAPLQKP